MHAPLIEVLEINYVKQIFLGFFLTEELLWMCGIFFFIQMLDYTLLVTLDAMKSPLNQLVIWKNAQLQVGT